MRIEGFARQAFEPVTIGEHVLSAGVSSLHSESNGVTDSKTRLS